MSAITDYITLHSKHRVFVPNGKLALISVEGSPQILEPGLHNFDASRFYWGGLQDATAPYLAVGSLHRLFVTAGRVACYTLAGVGTVLSEPGVRLIDSPTFLFLFERMADATETFLRVGSAARIVVPTGHLGKLTVGGEARLLEPGSYMLNDSNLRYVGAVKATEPLIVHGHLKADLVLNSSIGQHRFNQAFSATSRQAIPTKPQFETDLLLDAQPGAMVATPAVSSAAAAAALTPAAGGVRAPNSGAADSDPTAPSAGGPPATSSFKDAIHAVFMRDFRCGAAGLRRCCCRRAPPRTRVCAVQQLSHPRTLPPPRLPASRP